MKLKYMELMQKRIYRIKVDRYCLKLMNSANARLAVVINSVSLASASQGCSDGSNVGLIQPTVVSAVMHRDGVAHALGRQ